MTCDKHMSWASVGTKEDHCHHCLRKKVAEQALLLMETSLVIEEMAERECSCEPGGGITDLEPGRVCGLHELAERLSVETLKGTPWEMKHACVCENLSSCDCGGTRR
jgi:hypothetical protein